MIDVAKFLKDLKNPLAERRTVSFRGVKKSQPHSTIEIYMMICQILANDTNPIPDHGFKLLEICACLGQPYLNMAGAYESSKTVEPIDAMYKSGILGQPVDIVIE